MIKVGEDALSDVGWVLWAGLLGLESPIAARVEAARAAGCSRVSLSPEDVTRATEEGTKPRELGRRLRDSGLEIIIDPLMTWYDAPSESPGFPMIDVENMMRMAEELQAVAIGAIGNPMSSLPMEELAEPFAALCDRAAAVGTNVHLEFMPMLPIDDLSAGWSIVSGADRPNGGLLVDTWHIFRSGSDLALLEDIPGERIFGVQIADGPAEGGGDLGQETFHRLMPGDGSFDLSALLRILDKIGALRWVGAEVISPLTAASSRSGDVQVRGDLLTFTTRCALPRMEERAPRRTADAERWYDADCLQQRLRLRRYESMELPQVAERSGAAERRHPRSAYADCR